MPTLCVDRFLSLSMVQRVQGVVQKILGLPQREGKPSTGEWLTALGPLLAPLLICGVGVRVELVWVAVVWVMLLVPGLLAVNLFFPKPHPFSHIAARFGVASVLALLPAAVLGWTGCMLHWTLTTYLSCYVVAYLCLVAVLAHFLAHRRSDEAAAPSESSFDWGLATSRWVAGVVLVCIGVVLVGVVMSSPPSGDLPNAERYDQDARPDWWVGVTTGAVGSIGGGLILLSLSFARRKDGRTDVGDAQLTDARDKSEKPKQRNRGSKAHKKIKTSSSDLANSKLIWLTAILWLAIACTTAHIMRVVFSESIAVESQRGRMLLWNVDDVAYVS
ncbi:MAG: hypothetical protein GXP29_13555, partial [Planctomycetes bacterium]|nr:hypothetical protein [Planctomycetota bacterium]